ncbi:hypothetical protein ACFLUU_03630 [Chloroflexota bacterium]
MEVWQKVFLKDAEFVQSTHGKVGCVICHGGDSGLEDKELAHAGLVADPSEISCDTCHKDIACANDISLHTTVSGMKSALEARGGNLEEGSPLATAFENHCQQCHTSCGQCHVSRPDESGGGLVSGHEFRGTPSMQYNCVACHGSRVGDEYLGNNEGIPADVHWTKASMTCAKCHSQELHSSGKTVATRYQNPDAAKCENCHQDICTNTDGNPQHEQHLDNLSCQVCHSVTYSNCYSCHVAIDQQGLPYRTSDSIEMQFKIGLNPLRSSERPYKYVVLRHVPISSDTFDYYGENFLPDFNALPTWKYATPHNIQLDTPQNESCNACHGNKDLFLTEADVNEAEKEANRGVIVREIPGL